MGTEEKKKHRNRLKSKPGVGMKWIGIGLAGLALLLVVMIFLPPLTEEIKYVFSDKNNDQKIVVAADPNRPAVVAGQDSVIVPVDNEFSIIIPKISANAKVIANVDPLDNRSYQQALSKGVAHAKGTALPGQKGNIFLFAHSSADIWQARRYNAVFYLLSKLEKGDRISVVYRGNLFSYTVDESMQVTSDETKYMQATADNRLTLMTCWPPGTTMQRLIIVAKESGE